MTESTAAAPPRASSFEDYVDIFYTPSSVFERRRDASPWAPLLIVTGLFAIATYVNYTLLTPVYEAEFTRQMAQNPNVTAEQMAGMRRFAGIGAVFGGITTVPIATLVLGLVLWVVGKLLDAEQSLRSAFLVVVFSFLPRVLEGIVTALQSFLIDVNAAGSIYAVSLSPARFLSPDSPVAVLAMASRLSPFVLWSYAIVAIGLKVTGRVSMAKAVVAAAILWLLGALPTVLPVVMRG